MILIHPSIDPVIVSFGAVQIRWYSLAYVISFLIGIYIIKIINQKYKKKIKDKIIDDFFIWSIIGVILGGRIGYMLFYQLVKLRSKEINSLQMLFFLLQKKEKILIHVMVLLGRYINGTT